MDADRLVTLMLWVVLVVGAACVVLVCLATSDHLDGGPDFVVRDGDSRIIHVEESTSTLKRLPCLSPIWPR
jgi:hypothetical protein